MGQAQTKSQVQNVQVSHDTEQQKFDNLFPEKSSTFIVRNDYYSPIVKRSKEELVIIRNNKDAIYNNKNCTPKDDALRHEALNRGLMVDKKSSLSKLCSDVNKIFPNMYWENMKNYMTQERLQSVRYYMENYKYVDDNIRKEHMFDTQLVHEVVTISQHIRDAPPLQNDLILYKCFYDKNLQLDYHALLQQKNKLRDPTFFSASLNPHHVGDRCSIILRIHVPKGTKALFIDEYNNEFLFQLDSVLTFTEKRKTNIFDGQNIVELDTIDFHLEQSNDDESNVKSLDDSVWDTIIYFNKEDRDILNKITKFYQKLVRLQMDDLPNQLDDREKEMFVSEFWNITYPEILVSGGFVERTNDFDKVYRLAILNNIDKLSLPDDEWWKNYDTFVQSKKSTEQSKDIAFATVNDGMKFEFFIFNIHNRLHQYESDEISKHHNLMKVYLNETIEEFQEKGGRVFDSAVRVWRLVSKDVGDFLLSKSKAYLMSDEFLTAELTPTISGIYNNRHVGSSLLEIQVPPNTPMIYISGSNMVVFPTYTVMCYENINRDIVLTMPGDERKVARKVFSVKIVLVEQSRKLRAKNQPKDQTLSLMQYKNSQGLRRKLSELRNESSPVLIKDKSEEIYKQRLEESFQESLKMGSLPRTGSVPAMSNTTGSDIGSMVLIGSSGIEIVKSEDDGIDRTELRFQEIRKEHQRWETRQRKYLKSCIPSITRAGRDYFKVNKKGVIRKLTGCEWFHSSQFDFPAMERKGNSILFGVDDTDHGKSFIIKAFYIPTIEYNGNMVEALIYTELISKLLENQMTPHVVAPYAYVSCKNFIEQLKPKAKMFGKTGDYERLLAKINEMQEGLGEEYFDNMHLLCIEKVTGKVITFNDFIFAHLKDETPNPFSEKLPQTTEDDFKNVIFQVLYSLYIFNKSGLRHNDLHLDNILVQYLDDPVYHEYVVEHEGKNTSFYLKIQYKAFLIDFDGSSVTNSPLLKGMYEYMGEKNDPFYDGSIENSTIISNSHCVILGKCNGENNKLDAFKFLTRIGKYDQNEDLVLTTILNTWISKKLYTVGDQHNELCYFPSAFRTRLAPDYDPPDHDENGGYDHDYPWMFSNSKILMDDYFRVFRERIKNIDAHQPTKYEFMIPKPKDDDEYKCFISPYYFPKYYDEQEFLRLMRENDDLIAKHVPVITTFGSKFFGNKSDHQIMDEITACDWGLLSGQHAKVKFYTESKGEAFNFSIQTHDKTFMVKMNFHPSPLSNGGLVESLIYTNVIYHMLNENLTPHLVTPFAFLKSDTFRQNIESCLKQASGQGVQQDMLEEFQNKMEHNINSLCRNFELMGYNTLGMMRRFKNETFVLCIENVSGTVVDFFDVLYSIHMRDKKFDAENLRSLLFQLFYTLYIFNQWGLRQNDLHFGNILVQKLHKPLYHKYTVKGKDGKETHFYLQLFYKLYIIDFDRSSVVDSKPLRDWHRAYGIDSPLGSGNIRNTFIDQNCEVFGMSCNTPNPKVDTFEVLRRMKEYQLLNGLDWDAEGLDLRQWVSDFMFQGYELENHG